MNREATDLTDPDDYFKDTRMDLGSHIEELRGALWRAIKGLLVGMIAGFFFAQPVLSFISSPVEKQLNVFYQERVHRKMKDLYQEMKNDQNGPLAAQNAPRPIPCMASRMDLALGLGLKDVNPEIQTLQMFLPTLRKCQFCHGPLDDASKLRLDSRAALLKGGSRGKVIDLEDPDQSLLIQAIRREGKLSKHPTVEVSKHAVEQLMTWIKEDMPWPEDVFPVAISLPPVEVAGQLDQALRDVGRPPVLRALSITEAIIIWMKVGFYCGVVLASPWIFYQIWMFVAAGLYPQEKRLINYYLPISIFLFISGVTLCYYILPIGIHYLLNFNAWLNIEPDLRLTEWLSFAVMMPVIFGLAFQLPLVMFFLDRFGVLSVDFYVRHWKVVIFVLLILSGFFQASPDPLSMMLLAIPMWMLYGLGIVMCKVVPRSTPDLEVPGPEEMVEV